MLGLCNEHSLGVLACSLLRLSSQADCVWSCLPGSLGGQAGLLSGSGQCLYSVLHFLNCCVSQSNYEYGELSFNYFFSNPCSEVFQRAPCFSLFLWFKKLWQHQCRLGPECYQVLKGDYLLLDCLDHCMH